MKKIAFVCTGNTCRSPIAENILRELLQKAGTADYEVCSFGTSAATGEGMQLYAYRALCALGIRPKPHKAEQANKELIQNCDLIVTLTDAHLSRLRFPDNAYSLGALTGCGDIADPYGGSQETYHACAKELKSAITILIEKLSQLLS